MVRLHYAIHGMILIFIGLYITLFTGVYGAPLNAKSSINKTLDISTTQPSYDEYGGLVPGTDEYNKAFNKKLRQQPVKSDKADTDMSAAAQSDTRWNMVADSPDGDEQETEADAVRHGKDDSNKKNKERKRRKNRNKNKDKSDNEESDDGCVQRSDVELKELLGPAFNGRYMSVERPAESDEALIITEHTEETDGDTMADDTGTPLVRVLPFHVDSNYRRELPPDFYLDIAWYQEVIQSLPESAARLLRRIRSVFSSPSNSEPKSLPWQCESEIVWTDLGANYYPRFLRNVRCTRDNCWFGHFKCRPKAFTVNVLKRVRDSCKDGADGQEWVYEERAVTFCCECVEY